MTLSLLQVSFVVSGTVLLLIALDIFRRKRFTFLHIFAFLWSGGLLIIFSLFPRVLDRLGQVMGTQRGADVLVYGGILFLMYFVLFLFRKIEAGETNFTLFIRQLALREAVVQDLRWLVFLIRAYNEGSVLKKSLINVLNHHSDATILLVDDGSTDATRSIARELAETYWDRLVFLSHAKNQGAGAALETGFEYIRRYAHDDAMIVTIDPDEQFDLDDLPKFLNAMQDPNIGFVIGSRFLEGSHVVNMPMARKVILFLGKIFTLFLSRIHVTDSHNGYRAFRVATIRSVRLTMNGFAYASELIDEIARLKIPLREVPVTIHYTEYSLGKGQKSSNALKIARGMIWKKFF